MDARLEGLSDRQLLDLARAAVARHGSAGGGDGGGLLELARAAVARAPAVADVDGAGLLGLAGEVVRLASREVLDGTVQDAALRDSVEEWHRLEARVGAEKLRRVRELAERRAWLGVAMSAHGWVQQALGLTPGEARTLVNTATALARLPGLGGRLAAGEVGVGHAVETARLLGEVDRIEADRERDPACGGDPAAGGDGDDGAQAPGLAASGAGPGAAEHTEGAAAPGRPVDGGGTDAGVADPDDAAGGDGRAEDLAVALDRLAVEQAPAGDRRQLRRVLDAYADRATDGLLAERERRMRSRRRVWTGRRGTDGMGGIEGDLTPTALAKARAVLHALARKHSTDDSRNFEQRCHDALEQVFDWALAAGELPEQAGEQPRVLLLVTPEALHDASDADPAVLDGYGEISSATARELCCDAETTAVAMGDGHEILKVGRDRRRPNRAQRRAAFARDKGCVRCGAPLSQCQIHHVLWPWHVRGRTDIEVLVTVCWNCHAMIHHCGWRVARRENGSYTVLPPDRDSRPEPPDGHSGRERDREGQAALLADAASVVHRRDERARPRAPDRVGPDAYGLDPALPDPAGPDPAQPDPAEHGSRGTGGGAAAQRDRSPPRSGQLELALVAAHPRQPG